MASLEFNGKQWMNVLATLLWRAIIWEIHRISKMYWQIDGWDMVKLLRRTAETTVSLPANKSTGITKEAASQACNISLVNAQISTFIEF